jgi:hypothetical protein
MTNAKGGVLDRLLFALPYSALIVVAIFSLRRLDDFDTFWHLASGRWIAQHHAVPHTDVLSFTVPGNEWVNLQWLYDLLLYALYSVAGASGLVIASAACFVAAFALLARHLARHVGPVASTLLLIWVAVTVTERFAIRPEMASFPLLAAVQLVLADGRRHPVRLRWLVPLMILWANMHSLFVLGVAAIAFAIGGALLAESRILPIPFRRDGAWPTESRHALQTWGGAAIVATLANPFLLRAWLFPIKQLRLIGGSNGLYLAVGELGRPFSGYFPTFALSSYKALIFTFAGVALLAAWLRASERRPGPELPPEERERFDVGTLGFAAALAWLSLLARRNIAVFAIGVAPFMAACLGIVLKSMPRSWTARSGETARVAGALVFAGAVAIGWLGASNDWYAMTRETHEFGLGLFEPHFQTRATQFFREQKLPGPTFNDMQGGNYLAWDDPSGKGVYFDGRLEVYGTPFFTAYLNNFNDLEAWKREVDARGIQSVMLYHRWVWCHKFLHAVSATREWVLVYYDETVVIFVRAAGHADLIDAAIEAFRKTWLARNDAALTGLQPTSRWRWGISRAIGQTAYARLLQTLGETREALLWFQVAITGGLPPKTEVESRQHAAECLASLEEFPEARVHLARALELDPSNEATRSMIRWLDQMSGGKP